MLTKKMQEDKASAVLVGLEKVYRTNFIGHDIFDFSLGRAKVLDVDLIRTRREDGDYNLSWRFTLEYDDYDLRQTKDYKIDSVIALLPPKNKEQR